MPMLMNTFISDLAIPVMPAQLSVWDDPAVLLAVVGGFVLITIVLVLVAALYLLKVIRVLAREAAQESARLRGVPLVEEAGWWDKLMAWSSQSVPVEKEETILLDHNYDGIRELDNHLPPWWKWLFYATIVWGAVYLFTYHITGTFPLQQAELDAEIAQADEQARARKSAVAGPVIDETNVEVSVDPAALADGKATFQSICASCHRPDGGGDIGPNLTDAYWKHGGDIKSIFKVVSKGVQGTNMVAWGASMSPENIRNVSSYLLTLQGTNPPNGKKPEGDLYQPEKANTTVADTTKNSAGTP